MSKTIDRRHVPGHRLSQGEQDMTRKTFLLLAMIAGLSMLMVACGEKTRKGIGGEYIVEGTNPNGSLNDIAGIISKQGNVLGMMPHPENLIEAAHGGTDGRAIFEGALDLVA